ncbi:MAG: hypothetical protein ABIN99_07595 [Nitrosospira sp.]
MSGQLPDLGSNRKQYWICSGERFSIFNLLELPPNAEYVPAAREQQSPPSSGFSALVLRRKDFSPGGENAAVAGTNNRYNLFRQGENTTHK